MPQSNDCVVLPLKTTVPLFASKPPVLLQLPDTSISLFDAVKEPVMLTLLNALMLLPVTMVVPSKVTVPAFALKVPELFQLPPTFILVLGAVKEPVILI